MRAGGARGSHAGGRRLCGPPSPRPVLAAVHGSRLHEALLAPDLAAARREGSAGGGGREGEGAGGWGW